MRKSLNICLMTVLVLWLLWGCVLNLTTGSVIRDEFTDFMFNQHRIWVTTTKESSLGARQHGHIRDWHLDQHQAKVKKLQEVVGFGHTASSTDEHHIMEDSKNVCIWFPWYNLALN